MTLDPKTSARLAKIVALFDSPNDGERNVAITKAWELLDRHGQDMADIFDVLTALGAKASAVADFIDRVQACEPAGEATEQAESRADVIARYGSVQAALQPCQREALLRRAVRHGATFHAPPHERWTRSLYGYTPDQPDGPARDRAMRAIARAYPLPTTMRDALAEHAHWDRRDRELRVVLGHAAPGHAAPGRAALGRAALGRGGTTSGLDLTAHLRWELVRNLLRSELPVHGEAEFQMRMQFCADERQDEIFRATLEDVQQLAEMMGQDLPGAIVQSGNAGTALFARWLCDVVVPALQLPEHGGTGAKPTFEAMLRDAMRGAAGGSEPQRRG